MIKVQFLGLSPECIEGFPNGKERTFEGSLHLKPNQIYDISKLEFEYIKSKRKDLKFHEFKLGSKVVKSKIQKPKKVTEKKDNKSVSDKGSLPKDKDKK